MEGDGAVEGEGDGAIFGEREIGCANNEIVVNTIGFNDDVIVELAHNFGRDRKADGFDRN
jgi:hypothetical protein